MAEGSISQEIRLKNQFIYKTMLLYLLDLLKKIQKVKMQELQRQKTEK